MEIGDKIQIGNVEGATSKRGSKQNAIYTLTGRGDANYIDNHGKKCDLSHFWTAVNEKGVPYTIWDINKDLSRIGIYKNAGSHRTSYTSDFTIIPK